MTPAAIPASGASARATGGILTPLLWFFVVFGLLGLPFVLWLDVDALTRRTLADRAGETGRIIDIVRAYYSSDVVGRVIHANGKVTASNKYTTINGAIPIPATLSIELGDRISANGSAVQYKFISDYPFRGREAHALDPFETKALGEMREAGSAMASALTGSFFDRSLRVATPVVMGEACVECHNSHPDSVKRDWKVGDVRGLQQITIAQPIDANIFAFKYLLGFIALSALIGAAILFLQRRQSRQIGRLNADLSEANNFLAGISIKIAKYISPQIYRSIFSGERDVTITTERKKLTIFFSDIVDFTAATERLQPEDMTGLLNDYLTNMAAIAMEHGGTVDKFIGDAILVFFGDPETKGVREDARNCLRMAIAMKERLAELNLEWRRSGVENPFHVRMGINTGFCNVGNFGSEDRMDYTIVGAEANFAARLQTVAGPDEIVLSYETHELVSDMVRAEARKAISIKGIGRTVIPYVVRSYLGKDGERAPVFNLRGRGLELYIDTGALDAPAAQQAREKLREALAALDKRAAV